MSYGLLQTEKPVLCERQKIKFITSVEIRNFLWDLARVIDDNRWVKGTRKISTTFLMMITTMMISARIIVLYKASSKCLFQVPVSSWPPIGPTSIRIYRSSAFFWLTRLNFQLAYIRPNGTNLWLTYITTQHGIQNARDQLLNYAFKHTCTIE